MNTLNKIFSATVIAAAALAGANSATAGELTREQVVAQLAQARADGSIASYNADDSEHFLKSGRNAAARSTTVAAQPVSGTKTRAQVIAELRAAQADGTLALQHSEDIGDQLRFAAIQSQKAAATAMAE
ncbi:DUF4148 domain-containing protein [Pelomonas sp. KK5]|uniref:DUF4148 domain-containing protein n=1 Tax=Pelomonas sp. KK5 TaxID=1855730 RepID=UPI00097C0507|nr:DUF4148 domain-containing protein [Pelomonas sp. KK5]